MRQSESVKEVAAALAKAQAGIRTIVKDRTNPHFKNRYATLDAIMEAVRPVLAANGLSVVQGASETVDGFSVWTTLIHSSGEFLANTVPVPVDKANAQGVGSAITYGRRYGVSALLALATDDDDDGTEATKPTKPKAAEKPTPDAKPERVTPPKFDGTLEGAMTFPFPGKGEYHGKPLGDVSIDVLRAARDAAGETEDAKYADFIARAERVISFHEGQN